MAKPPRVEMSYYYAAPPAEVYAALTEPKRLTTWFAPEARVTLRKGGTYRLRWPGGVSMRGRVKKFEPGRLLVIDWIDRLEGGRVFETEARFELERTGRGTLLSITHSGFQKGPRWTALYGGVTFGWTYYLLNLRSVLEHGTDLRDARDQS
jgi:uncharacterized protein YndB with AHSA1/START domain